MELDSRRKIYDHIRRVPGIHMRRLERELDIPMSTLEYHLYQLERHGLVAAHKEGQKKGYFVREDVDARDQHYLYYLRQRRARRILLEILENPDITMRDLTRQLELGAPTVSYHLKKLRKAEIIEPVWLGRNKQYEIVEPDRLLRLVDTYRQTFRGLRREETPASPDPGASEAPPAGEAIDEAQLEAPLEIGPVSPSDYPSEEPQSMEAPSDVDEPPEEPEPEPGRPASARAADLSYTSGEPS